MTLSLAAEAHRSLVQSISLLLLMENDLDYDGMIEGEYRQFSLLANRTIALWDLVCKEFDQSRFHPIALKICSKLDGLLRAIIEKRGLYEPVHPDECENFLGVSDGLCGLLDWKAEIRHQISDDVLGINKRDLISGMESEFAAMKPDEEYSHDMLKCDAACLFGIKWDALNRRIKKGQVRVKGMTYRTVKIHRDDLPK